MTVDVAAAAAALGSVLVVSVVKFLLSRLCGDVFVLSFVTYFVLLLLFFASIVLQSLV